MEFGNSSQNENLDTADNCRSQGKNITRGWKGKTGDWTGKSVCMQSQYVPEVYRVSQEEWTKLREGVPYVKLYRYNPKHLYPKLNGYGDNGKRSLKL